MSTHSLLVFVAGPATAWHAVLVGVLPAHVGVQVLPGQPAHEETCPVQPSIFLFRDSSRSMAFIGPTTASTQSSLRATRPRPANPFTSSLSLDFLVSVFILMFLVAHLPSILALTLFHGMSSAWGDNTPRAVP
ncbi:hypothetical protein B0H13DRAFT_1019640 [Mycena leptocephala]|nr:hypothetical protein B0H13DRAFT_1019640 [Mycena leptocephala]